MKMPCKLSRVISLFFIAFSAFLCSQVSVWLTCAILACNNCTCNYTITGNRLLVPWSSLIVAYLSECLVVLVFHRLSYHLVTVEILASSQLGTVVLMISFVSVHSAIQCIHDIDIILLLFLVRHSCIVLLDDDNNITT